ncbi:MAG: 2-amino-4-hydroxy-6-hydroxymethyldihydropteridine diphosphokinase [Desulfovibrionales bacterium]|nr:MAG: 2-amino-4-hydroxy-6-hydroxymethyldihydropteridine diphosphokinase [Desulfovibrionales bacterium]
MSLGSNLGDLEDNLERARNAMSALNDVQLTACSPVYYTEPQDVRNQPWFANQVVLLDCRTVWTAPDLLQALLGIESQMGRIRGQSKGPRIIDLDLLLFGTQHHASRDLILPHPRIQDRAFVLIPLLDIAPYLSLPDGTNLSKALERLSFHVHDRRIEQAEEG